MAAAMKAAPWRKSDIIKYQQVLHSLAPGFTIERTHFCGEYNFCWAMPMEAKYVSPLADFCFSNRATREELLFISLNNWLYRAREKRPDKYVHGLKTICVTFYLFNGTEHSCFALKGKGSTWDLFANQYLFQGSLLSLIMKKS